MKPHKKPATGRTLKRITRVEAFKVYAGMPHERRSISELRRRLMALGYKVGVGSLSDWCREERWDEKITDVATGEDLAPLPMAAVVAWELNGSTEGRKSVNRVREAMDDVANLVSQMAKTAAVSLGNFQPENFEEALQMIRATGHLVEVTARVREILSRVDEGVDAKTIEGTVNGPEFSDAAAAIAAFRGR